MFTTLAEALAVAQRLAKQHYQRASVLVCRDEHGAITVKVQP